MDEHDLPGGATGPLPPSPATPTAPDGRALVAVRSAAAGVLARPAPASNGDAEDGATEVVVELVGAARRSRRGLVLGIVAALVVVAGGVGAFLARAAAPVATRSRSTPQRPTPPTPKRCSSMPSSKSARRATDAGRGARRSRRDGFPRQPSFDKLSR
jgi:hypothetical protein